MINNQKQGKHASNNRESLEGKLLAFIREYRKLSQVEVAEKLEIKKATIDHLENGRKFYTPDDINLFLNCYEVSFTDFTNLLSMKMLKKTAVNYYLMNRYEEKRKS